MPTNAGMWRFLWVIMSHWQGPLLKFCSFSIIFFHIAFMSANLFWLIELVVVQQVCPESLLCSSITHFCRISSWSLVLDSIEALRLASQVSSCSSSTDVWIDVELLEWQVWSSVSIESGFGEHRVGHLDKEQESWWSGKRFPLGTDFLHHQSRCFLVFPVLQNSGNCGGSSV
jgi:hypothetical protein